MAVDLMELVERLDGAANGVVSLKTERGDYGLLAEAAACIRVLVEQNCRASAGVEWRCFHCDDVFTSRWTARDHFGHTEDAKPACQIRAGEIGLVATLREAERDAMDAWFALQNESTTTAKAFRAMQGRHQRQIVAMEQVGYERGLADAKAHPETLGLTPHPQREGRGRMSVQSTQSYDEWRDENQHLVDLSNRIRRWSIRRGCKSERVAGKWDGGNFAEAARALGVTVDEVAAAVEWHYWMFTLDTDWPAPIRRIEHEGE